MIDAVAPLVLLLASCQFAMAQVADNGIVVGQAKLYDERSLESLLGSIQQDLTKTTYINPAAAAQNEGMLQGGELSANQLTASVAQIRPGTTAAAPAASPVSINVSPGGSAPAAASAAPTAPIGSGGPTFSSNTVGISTPLAISSEDTLQQQLALSFEAANLKLLLEHALSDRVIFDQAGSSPVPRDLAVLGFQVTVEPRSEDKSAVAEAEITITNPTGATVPLGRPEVAMMLPQDKTYNVAKVTSNSSTISLAAFAQPFLGSLSAGSSRNSTYVVYDVDTVALQRPYTDSNSVSFAWQFRPVLGEKAVQPGTRQVYVLLSLPVTSNQDYTPVISVKTYWKKLDTKSETVSDETMSGRTCAYTLDPLSIHKLNDYDEGLRPTIDNVDMYEAGNGAVYVEASGANFTKNMSVVLNGAPIDAANDFFEQGGRLLSFRAPVSALSYSNPRIVGPYGLPVDLIAPVLKDAKGAVISPAQPNEGLHIKNVTVTPLDTANSIISIRLVSKGDYTQAPALPANAQLIVTVGNEVYGLDDNPVGKGSDSDDTHTTFTVRAPNSDLHSAQKVTVRYLFAGDDYRDDYQIPAAAFSVESVSVVSCDPEPPLRPKGAAQPAKSEAEPASAAPSVVLALKGSFQSSLKAYLYNGSRQIEFDPTAPVSNSFLLLQAKTTTDSPETASPAPAEGRGPTNPFGESAPGSGGAFFSLALLTAERSQLIGSSYIVVYQPNCPAQVLPLADCVKSVKQYDASGTWPATPLVDAASAASAAKAGAGQSAQSAPVYITIQTPQPAAQITAPPGAETTSSTPASQTTAVMGATTVTTTGGQPRPTRPIMTGPGH